MESVVLEIQGMHCGGCVSAVKALLEREAGVKTVAVTFEIGEARLLYDPAATDANRLSALVERLGYRVARRAP